MKKLILIVSLLGAAAWGLTSASKVTTVAYTAVANEPTSATQGLPVELNGPGTQELRRLILTVKQPDDAGAESQDLTTFRARAWKYTVQGTLADGGTLFRWSRMPELDLAYLFDGGTALPDYIQINNGATLTTAVPIMGNQGRVTYTIHNASIQDAGTGNVEMYLEGRYVDPLHP